VACKSDFVKVAHKNPEFNRIGAANPSCNEISATGTLNSGKYMKMERKFELPQHKNDGNIVKNT